ncbi:MAG: YbaN family protein [Bacillota bacterium]
MKRILLICLGSIALALGGIGLLLPVWPTTPFVLCAAGCFGASSPRLLKKLENMRLFGEYVQNYRNKTGISSRARWTSIAFLWATLGISAALVHSALVWIILGVVGVSVSIHILTIRAKVSQK